MAYCNEVNAGEYIHIERGFWEIEPNAKVSITYDLHVWVVILTVNQIKSTSHLQMHQRLRRRDISRYNTDYMGSTVC